MKTTSLMIAGIAAMAAAPSTAAAAFFEQSLPFRETTLEGVRIDRPILLGTHGIAHIAENYHQVWAIDLTGFTKFKLDVRDINLHFDDQDRLRIMDRCGATSDQRTIHEYHSNEEVGTVWVDATSTCDTSFEFGSPLAPGLQKTKRVYLVLDSWPTLDKVTGDNPKRTLILDGIRVPMRFTGYDNRKVALVGHGDVPYLARVNGVLKPRMDYVATDGTVRRMPPPWDADARSNPLAKPQLADGWYLIGKHLGDASEGDNNGFYHLTYYNENTSRVRSYLYNTNLQEHSLHIARYSIRTQRTIGGAFEQEPGAIFPVDADPSRWSEAELVVPGSWPKGSWVMVESPIHFPMLGRGYLSSPYGALYRKNYRFAIDVQGVDLATGEGRLVGTAIGDIVLEEAAEANLLTGLFGALRQGKSWYDKLTGIGDALARELPGAAVVSPYIGGALAGLGYLKALYDFDPSPAAHSVAIALKLEAKIQLQLTTRFTVSTRAFYLPGTLDFDAAMSDAAFANASRETAETLLPLFPRVMGHFGYKYDPADMTMPVMNTPKQAAFPAREQRFYVRSGPGRDRYWFYRGDREAHMAEPEALVLPVTKNPYAAIWTPASKRELYISAFAQHSGHVYRMDVERKPGSRTFDAKVPDETHWMKADLSRTWTVNNRGTSTDGEPTIRDMVYYYRQGYKTRDPFTGAMTDWVQADFVVPLTMKYVVRGEGEAIVCDQGNLRGYPSTSTRCDDDWAPQALLDWGTEGRP